ncbi:MAG: hypothetical protein AAF623_21495, partial [Planctomycetota bacterium]
MVDESGIVRSVDNFKVEDDIHEMFLKGTTPAKSESEAEAIGGYWHNGKCWRYFEDSSIPTAEVAKIVDDRLAKLEQSTVSIKEQNFTVNRVGFDQSGKTIEILVGFNDGEKIKFKSYASELSTEKISGSARGHFRQPGESEVTYTSKGRATAAVEDDGMIRIKGSLRPKSGNGEKSRFVIEFDDSVMSAGSSTLDIAGEEAFLAGSLGTRTYDQIRKLISDHPEVKTLVLKNVDGSVDDDINLHTGRLIRNAGLTTKVLADSEVYSGGVDLFCSGASRIIEPGAKLGVHSWAD